MANRVWWYILGIQVGNPGFWGFWVDKKIKSRVLFLFYSLILEEKCLKNCRFGVFFG